MAQLLATPKRPPFMKMMLPIVAIGVLGYMGNVLLTARASKDQAPVEETAGYPATVATSSCCKIRVNSAQRSDPGSERLTVNVTIDNISSGVVQFSPGLQMTLKDKAGFIHNYTAAYLTPGTSVGGPLKAKGTRTESLDFNVPVNTAGYTLIFQQDASTPPVILGLP